METTRNCLQADTNNTLLMHTIVDLPHSNHRSTKCFKKELYNHLIHQNIEQLKVTISKNWLHCTKENSYKANVFYSTDERFEVKFLVLK